METRERSNKHVASSTAFLLATLFLSLALPGCSGSFGGAPPTGASAGGGNTGTLVLFGEDQAAGNVLAFELTIVTATLTDAGGGAATLLPSPVELEWRSRGLAPTVLSITQVPAATYNQLTLVVTASEMTVFDPLTNTFPEILHLTTSSVTVPVNLTISSGQVAGLRLDLDLRGSVQLDANNNFLIDPVFTAVPTSFIVGQLAGDIDDALGAVTALDLAANQLTVTVLPSQQVLTVAVGGGTLFDGVTGLSTLRVSDAIEVDARLQSNGDFLAQEIKRESPSSNQQLRGLVLARTPAVGTLTSFDLLVLEETPDSTSLDAGDIVSVTVDASTTFRFSLEDLPVVAFPNLDFDRQTLRPGQLVHLVQRAGSAGFTADSIALKEITLVGQVGLAVGVNTFDFVPDGDFYSQNGLGQLTVVVSGVTELENMPAGLGSLQPNQSIVAVRGVLVFQGGNGVLVSKRVRLLQP